jgi:arginase
MNILTAPTSLGNRPYEDDGTARWTTLGPSRIRAQGIVGRLQARDLGDIAAADYRDFVRPPGAIRNEDLINDHMDRIARALAPHDDFTLILGGDCSVLLGSLRGLARGRDVGLVYFDAHSDFNTPESTVTGAVAGMVLAMATGRGARRLVRDENVVAVGIREREPTLDDANIHFADTAPQILDYLERRDFFIHLDVDVLDPEFMPFVDSPVRGGLDPETLTSVLAPLVHHPRAIGMELTIYDPRDDHDSRGAALLVDILEKVFTD